MKKRLWVLCVGLPLSGVSFGFDASAELQQAVLAVNEFSGALKSELVAAMQSGGPVEAIEVCNTQAVVIGQDVSQANKLNLSRVSLQNRNPGNTPNAWQTVVLMDFEEQRKAGEKPDALTWHEIAQTEDGQEFRYMKAIPTGELCLACHGATLAPAVADRLAELYPDDKATGFGVGDLRGAFVVTRRLD